MLIPRFPHSSLQSSMPMHPLLGSGTKRGSESLCVCSSALLIQQSSWHGADIRRDGERKVPAWKVITDCSVGSVQCASLVLFVSNQSSKFPALSGVSCVNLYACFLAENDPIYQLFLYSGMIFFILFFSVGEGHFQWAFQCMNSHRELDFTNGIYHFKPFMDKHPL